MSDAKVIGVDGGLGAGKSTLAGELSRRLGFQCIHLDDYLEPHKGRYFENIDMASLQSSITAKPTIIEGICLVKVLQALGIKEYFSIYVPGVSPAENPKDRLLLEEIAEYFLTYRPQQSAEVIYTMNDEGRGSSAEIDIVFIKAKTAISIVLAIGGILSILVGALIIAIGAQSSDTAVIKFSGIEISAKGIGGVILMTSAIWAYLAYMARPQYSRKREVKESKKSDGTYEKHELESSTVMQARPEEISEQ